MYCGQQLVTFFIYQSQCNLSRISFELTSGLLRLQLLRLRCVYHKFTSEFESLLLSVFVSFLPFLYCYIVLAAWKHSMIQYNNMLLYICLLTSTSPVYTSQSLSTSH